MPGKGVIGAERKSPGVRHLSAKLLPIADEQKSTRRLDWVPITITAIVTVIGWFVVSYFSAEDDHTTSLREDRRDAYLTLLDTAGSCIDIANGAVVQRDFAYWLGQVPSDESVTGSSSVPSSEPTASTLPASTEPTSTERASTEPTSSEVADATGMPGSILEATESVGLCRQRLNTAVGGVELLTDDAEIRSAANDLADSANDLQSAELEALRLSAMFSPNSDDARVARDQLTAAEEDYEGYLETFVNVAGDDTRDSGRSLWGTVSRAAAFVGFAVVVWLVLRLAWFGWSRWRRPSPPKP